jgi:hypothetical protein
VRSLRVLGRDSDWRDAGDGTIELDPAATTTS